MSKVRYSKRIVSIIFIFVFIINMLTPIHIYAVPGDEAGDVATRQSSFLNFYSDETGMDLNMDNMTAQDYYVLYAFFSNFFRPGETTLAELYNVKDKPDESKAFTEFVTALGRSGNDTFKQTLGTIVHTIANDTISGIEEGKCTLTDGSRRLTGLDFLWLMSESVDIDTGIISSKKVYFGTSNLAFDFSSPATKAAFQTVASFNPKLFLDGNGLETLDALFLDAVGNVWGLDLKTSEAKTKFDSTNTLSGLVGAFGAENFYLILPACLNPSTFSAGVTNTSDLKMPLMNAYTLASVVDLDAFGDTLSSTPIPFYNIFAETGAFSSDRNSGLNIIGVQSLTPFLLNTGYYKDKDSGKNTGIYGTSNWNIFSSSPTMRQDIANFLYNPANIGINQTIKNGIGEYSTNTYVVFSTNMDLIDSYVSSSQDVVSPTTGNRNIDMHTTLDGYAFSVFENSSYTNSLNTKSLKLLQQQKLLMYLFSPTILNFNQVAMNFYYEDAFKSSVPSDVSEQYASKMYKDLSTEEILLSQTGMRGLDLFFNDNVVPDTFEDGDYIGVTPQNITNSYFTELLLDQLDNAGIGLDNIDLYRQIKNNQKSGSVFSLIKDSELLGDIFNNTLNFENWISAVTDSSGSYLVWANSTNKDSVDSNGDFKEDYPYKYMIRPKGITTFGTKADSIMERAVGRTLGIGERRIASPMENLRADFTNEASTNTLEIKTSVKSFVRNRILAHFAYSVFGPSDVLTATLKQGVNFQDYHSGKLLGNDSVDYKSTIKLYKFSNQAFTMGIYFGYIVDMMGIEKCDSESGLAFKGFDSKFLPKYGISASGGSMAFSDEGSVGTGVIISEDTSFEEKQKDLINRIYGLTNDSNNDYRNSLIKNILEGFFLTMHRTITGTWGDAVGSVVAGNNSTYQSLTGYIYTPILEELPFTATLMNNYVKIYIVCMILIAFFLILMVLLNIRSWQQGIISIVVLSVVLLFPYILISNTINISNKVADSIYSDRFDFWAMSDYQERLTSLTGVEAMNEADTLIALSNASSDLTYTGTPGVKVKWMSPKKVDMFLQMYNDKSLSESFVVNTQIFKWLFSTFTYDSEFVDTDVYGSYLYRPFNSIALEADAYYNWGKSLMDSGEYTSTTSFGYNDYTFDNIPVAVADSLSILNNNEDYKRVFTGGLTRLDNNYYKSSLSYPDKKLEDINTVSAIDIAGVRAEANKIGLWGMANTTVSTAIVSDITADKPGILSNLPSSNDGTYFDGKSYDDISKALFLKNTESPFYYFYSVLKYRYQENSVSGSFKKELLNNQLFKVSNAESAGLDRNAQKMYRDFLDLEGLFSYVIPYLHLANEYVIEYQDMYGSEIEDFNFRYEVDEDTGDAVYTSDGSDGYAEAVERKNNMNRVWNMYSPWVDSLYGLNNLKERVVIGRETFYIEDTLNPTYYLKEGRSMIYSEADMEVKGYSYKDLTDVERRIQAVLEKTYTDWLYLINYYDMDDDVLLTMAAMYATFNFNAEFSQDSFLGESLMLYPQGLELKNFNYDAYMRLAILNSTGENVFASNDLYSTVLSKTSIFTGILLVLCDLLACIAIPFMKFIIIVGLLFLGILLCVSCILTPPEKLMPTIFKSLLTPTALFMFLNILFAYGTSMVVGEGLTAYVGSKNINFATNDPTITMALMAILGVAYLFVAWKILKLLIEAYKEFGMASFITATGVLASAFTSAVGNITRKTTGAAVGMATAEKGHRLEGAFEGGSLGATGVLNRRIQDRRYKEMMGGGIPNGIESSNKVTESINAKAGAIEGKQATQAKLNAKGSVKPTSDTSTSGTVMPPSELDREFTKDTDKKANKLGRALSSVAHAQEKARDKLDDLRYKKDMVGLSLKEKRLQTRDKIKETKDKVVNAPKSAKKYLNDAVQTYKGDKEYYKLKRETRTSERTKKILERGMSINRSERARKGVPESMSDIDAKVQSDIKAARERARANAQAQAKTVKRKE